MSAFLSMLLSAVALLATACSPRKKPASADVQALSVEKPEPAAPEAAHAIHADGRIERKGE